MPWNKGQTLTSGHRKNIGKGLLGHVISKDVRKKISLSLMGHKLSKKTREKISRSVHLLMTEEHKQRMRKKAIVLGWPKAARKKSEKFNKNFVFTAKMRKKISEAHRREKHYNWKGGIASLTKIIRHSLESKIWRQRIFVRDNYTCQKCNVKNRYLMPHHKKAFSLVFSEFLKFYSQFSPVKNKEILAHLAISYGPFWNIANGGTLCEDCHTNFHSVYSRKGDNTVKQWNEFMNSL